MVRSKAPGKKQQKKGIDFKVISLRALSLVFESFVRWRYCLADDDVFLDVFEFGRK